MPRRTKKRGNDMARKSQTELITGPIIEHNGVAEKAIARETTKAEGYFSVYANDIQMQTTPWDVRLTLGELEVATKGDPTAGPTPFLAVKVLGDIRISPQLAKKFAIIMMDQLKH